MKKIFIIITTLLIVFSLSGCNSSGNREDFFDYTQLEYEQKFTVNEDNLIKKGKLVVGTSPDYAPYSFLDLSKTGLGKVQGSESAIAYYVAQTLGLQLEFKEIAFDGLMTELNKDGIDVVFAGLTYSVDRDKNYTFTDTYHKSGDGGQLLLSLKENVDKYDSFDSINKSSVTIGAQDQSVQHGLVSSELPKSTFQPFKDIPTGVLLLEKGTIDLIAISKYNADALLLQNDNLCIVESYTFPDSDHGTMGLLKKDNPLASDINKAIEIFDQDIYANWLEEFTKYSDNMISDDSNFLIEYAGLFMSGTGITLALSLITVIFGSILGVFLLFVRKLQIKPLRYLGNIYVEFIRGVPLLLLLWLIYMVAPNSWPAFLSIVVALILNSGAYVCEIMRAGIEAVDKGQYEACRSLGLSKFQTMKQVIIPQAIKKILPALGNEFVMLIKETSLASVFFVGDLMTVKNNITAITYLTIEPFIVVGVIYFALTFSATKLIQYFEKRMEA